MVGRIIEYLNGAIKEIPSYAENPIDPVEEYFVVEQTGGDVVDHTKSVIITIKSYSTSLEKALQNNTLVIAAMGDLILQDDISLISLNGYYNNTDTAKKKYRYQAVFQIVPF